MHLVTNLLSQYKVESGGVTACSRWISLGLLCIGLGSLVWTTPHFATPPYQPLEPGTDNTTSGAALCGAEGAGGVAETAAAGGGGLQVYRCHPVSPPCVPRHAAVPRYVFVAAQLLHGAGASPLITLGITLLDQAAAPASSPLYIGVLQAFFIIGPAAGYILGRCGLRDLS